MQTFLPYPNPSKTAKCLDNKRLGKQRVECIQIALCLLVKESRWRNHPAVKMWKGYEKYLVEKYLFQIMKEWYGRDFKNNKCFNHYLKLKEIVKNLKMKKPKWITKEVCQSHRSNLVRKSPRHYRQFFPNVRNDLPYIWPVK